MRRSTTAVYAQLISRRSDLRPNRARITAAATNLQELITYTKANRPRCSSSAGVGSATPPAGGANLADRLHRQRHPYRGEGPAMQDVIGDRNVRDHPERRGAGQRREREGDCDLAGKWSPIIPNLATSAEQGLPGDRIERLERVLPAEGHARTDVRKSRSTIRRPTAQAPGRTRARDRRRGSGAARHCQRRRKSSPGRSRSSPPASAATDAILRVETGLCAPRRRPGPAYSRVSGSPSPPPSGTCNDKELAAGLAVLL